MTEPTPLVPPAVEGILALNPPAPMTSVVATAAPKMAPPVPVTAVPQLDGKVDAYLHALMASQPGAPEFARQANDVRSMGDTDIRRAAESSNRLLKTPVKALDEGGLSDTSKVGQTLTELRRTVERNQRVKHSA